MSRPSEVELVQIGAQEVSSWPVRPLRWNSLVWFSKSFSFQLRLWHSAAKSTERCVILIKPNDMYSIGVEGGHNPLKWLSVWHRSFFKWVVCAVIKGSHQKWYF